MMTVDMDDEGDKGIQVCVKLSFNKFVFNEIRQPIIKTTVQ